MLPFREGRESGQLLKRTCGPGALFDVGEMWAYVWANVKKPVGRRLTAQERDRMMG